MKVKIVNTSRHPLPSYATPLSAGGRLRTPANLAGYQANFPASAEASRDARTHAAGTDPHRDPHRTPSRL